MAEYESEEKVTPESEDFMSEARAKFVKSRDAMCDDVENARNEILTTNKFPAYIRQVVNDARQNRPQIRFHPVDDNADPQTAEVLNGLIRNIEVSSRASIAYDSAIFQSVSGGFGCIRVNLDYAHDDTFEQDIKIECING